jgi:hypothetical protein
MQWCGPLLHYIIETELSIDLTHRFATVASVYQLVKKDFFIFSIQFEKSFIS